MSLPEPLKHKSARQLHLTRNHPVERVKRKILQAMPGFKTFEALAPIVTLEQNFDSLLIPKDHPSRSKSDTYYVDEDHVYRTHTSAHQVDLLRAGERRFLVSGQVYRRDAIDATHYPIFHQMEGVALMNDGVNAGQDLIDTLGKIVAVLFGDAASWTTKPDYFPFTDPSFEVVVNWEGREIEVAGCGVIHPGVIRNAGLDPGKDTGWAFGLGLDRLAMRLYQIPDIRLLWSEDPRFLSQFEAEAPGPFRPFSSHPACYKDIAFWVPAEYQVNDFLEVIRSEGGDLVEEVKEIDSFEKGGQISRCYRIVYRSMERSLTNGETDAIQDRIRRSVSERLGCKLR